MYEFLLNLRPKKVIEEYLSRLSIKTILIAAGVLRISSIFFVRSYMHPVTWEFGMAAQAIFHGYGDTKVLENGLRVPSAHMPPLYPYFLGSLWKLFGESAATYLGLELFQAFLGVLLVLMIYRLAIILTSKRTALLAATLVAVWPSFIYLCNEFHSISIYILLGVAAVYYLVRYIEVSHSWLDIIGLGLCMGGLLLCRAEAIALLLCYALILVWCCGRRHVVRGIMACLIAGICLAPWTIRNDYAFGRFVLISTSGGFNLWIGHNPYATGNSEYNFDYLTPSERTTYFQETGRRDDEVVASHLYSKFAFDFIRSHPREEFRLALRKLFFFVLFDPTHKKASNIAYWGPSLLLTLLASCGMWFRKKELLKRDLPLIFSILFAILLSVAVFSLPRYRIAIDPFLAIFAAEAIVSLALYQSSTKREKILPAKGTKTQYANTYQSSLQSCRPL